MSIKIRKESVKCIHQTFSLLYYFLFHTGCLGCKIRNDKELYYNKSYKFLGYIYRLTFLTGLIGCLLYKIYDEESNEAMMGRLTPVVKVILAFECFICPIVYVNVSISLDWFREEYIKFSNTLQSLDEKLQHHFPGIQWNYHKSSYKYNYMTLVLYVFYTAVSIIYIFNVIHCTCGWISSLILSICYSCVSGAPGFAEFLFTGNMDMLRLRFRLIRKLLLQNSTSIPNVKEVAKFRILENYFTDYSGLIASLNQIFFVVSISGLFHDFAIITILGYVLCSKALDTKVNKKEFVFIGLFMAPRIYKFVVSPLYGYATQKERTNCFREFIKMGYSLRKSPLIQQTMEGFLHWRMHNNYRLTVGKTFNCDLSIIFSTLNSIVNYIMILIQLQFQHNYIANRLKNNIELIKKDVEII